MRRSVLLLNWSMVLVAAALLALIMLSLFGWRRADPDDAGTLASGASAGSHPAAEQMRQFFTWPATVAWRQFTNGDNPFFTTAIQSPPAPQGPTPPPATRKVDVTYQGYFETSAGVRRAMVQVADRQILAGRGERVVSDLVAVEIELQHLSLTNAAGQAVKLGFNKVQPIDVPAK